LLQAQGGGELDPTIDAEEAAAFLIDAYEGALIRMKSEGVASAFSRFRKFALEPLLDRKPRAPVSAQGKAAGRHRNKAGSPKSSSEKPSIEKCVSE
jgi:hypothetical protein